MIVRMLAGVVLAISSLGCTTVAVQHTPTPTITATATKANTPTPTNTPTDKEQFERGYEYAGLRLDLEERMVNTIIPCESKWDKYAVNPTSGAKGLNQFLDSTWATVASITGLWDWTNPVHQGFNSSVLAHIADPTSQWSCYYG